MQNEMSELYNELNEIIKGCSRCGFCMAECPAYGSTKIEWDAARGRVKLASDLIKGKTDLLEELKDPIDTCLRCGSCYEICPSKVNTPKAVQLMRTIRYKSGKMKLPYRILFRKVMQNPKFMTMGARFVSRIQNITREEWTSKGIIAHYLPSARMIPKLPGKSARKFLPVYNNGEGKRRGKVLYFLGCATDLVYPEVAKSTLKTLTSQGIDVEIPAVSCCGLPAYTYGHIDATVQLAKHNLSSLKFDEFDAVVSDCPTCLSFLKEYKDLPLDNDLRERAEGLYNKIQSIPDFLLNIGLLEPKHAFKQVVTYHQPCHIGRYPGAANSIEKILTSLPGIEFRKADNQNTCCGGAGSYCFTQVDRSLSILEKKIDGLTKTNAEVLITNCPACMMQLDKGLKFNGGGMQLANLVDIISMYYS